MTGMMIGRIVFKSFLCSSLFLLLVAGCGTKGGDYEHASSSMKPEGHLLGSTKQDDNANQQENFSSGELELLNQTGVNPLAADTASEEYLATYGRSTAPLYPVFFDFDSSAISADQQENLNSSGRHLLENNSLRLMIEGNCDERGSADYNLALGELRAINVKKFLVNLGVADSRIATISYGSQRPLYPGNDEDSWAANRRADLVLP